MPFTVREFHDLVEILENEPAWRVELRRLLLTEDILGLPQAVRDLTRAVQELITERRQNEARFARMEGDLAALKADTSQMKSSVGKLEKSVVKLETNVGKLDSRVGKLETSVARLNGSDLERQLRERPFVYLGRLAVRLKTVTDAELAVLLEDAVERGLITEDEMEDAKLVDTVARGRGRAEATPLYLAVEVSAAVDRHDLERARRRAAVIEKASGVSTRPVVAGERLREDAQQMAEQQGMSFVIFSQTN